MGTQQILLIVLSVIIVGAAIAVGITMFTTQAVNSARQAVISDMNNLAAQALQYYRTPVNLGGAGYGSDESAWTDAALASYIDVDAAEGVITNPNGTYTVSAVTDPYGAIFTSEPNEPGLEGKEPSLAINVETGEIAVTTDGNPATVPGTTEPTG